MLDKKNMRWVLAAAVVLLIWSMQGTIPKEAVGDVDGQPCTEDADCPCWGEIESAGITAHGLGVSQCTDSVCDTTYCFDVEPIEDWLVDHPFAWVKDPANAMTVVVIVGLTVMVIFWPKI